MSESVYSNIQRKFSGDQPSLVTLATLVGQGRRARTTPEYGGYYEIWC